MQVSDYATICVPSKLIRENWYSKTYAVQTKFTQDTDPVTINVTHITTPFTKEMEAIAAKKMQIKKEDMAELYEWLWLCIKNHVQKLRILNKKNVQGATLLYKAETVQRETGERDVYLLTEAYDKAIDVFFSKEEITLSEIVSFGIRLGNIIRDASAEGIEISHGNLSMDALYVGQDGRIYIGDWFFATEKGVKKPPRYLYEDYPHIPESMFREGKGATIKTDIAAISSILWNILSEIPVDEFYPYRAIPSKAPTKLLETLKFGLEAGDDDLPFFRKQLSEIKRETAKDEILGKLKFKLNAKKPYRWQIKQPEATQITTESVLKTLDIITSELP